MSIQSLDNTGQPTLDVLSPVTTAAGSPSGRRLVRQIALVVATTAVVSVLPALAAARLIAGPGLLSLLASGALAVALSTVIAYVGAAIWSRRRGEGDVLFSDLMAWTWARRLWTGRRLAVLQRRVRDAEAAGEAVPIVALARMSRLLEARDSYTFGHSRRVARFAQLIARGMRLTREEIETVRLAAMVHDIGKLHTPRAILNKPGRLTDAEFEVVKRHPGEGAAMLAQVGEPGIVAMVRHHHERLDGRGYPDGLEGSAIPLGARIIAVADTFDALTSTRPYRPVKSHKAAIAILTAEAGTQLDGAAVEAFTHHYSGRRSVAFAVALGRLPEIIRSTFSAGGTSVLQGLPAVGTTAAVALAAAVAAGPPATAAKNGDRLANVLTAQPGSANQSVSSAGSGLLAGITGTRGVPRPVAGARAKPPASAKKRRPRARDNGSPSANRPAGNGTDTNAGAAPDNSPTTGNSGTGNGSGSGTGSGSTPPVTANPPATAPTGNLPGATVPSVSVPSVTPPPPLPVSIPPVKTPSVSLPGSG